MFRAAPPSISKGSCRGCAAPNLPGQNGGITPVLQAEDGSFIGTYNDNSGQTDMVAFDQTGNVRWIVPSDQPQIAIAGGGVRGLSGTIYDQNGSATGQISNPPIESWLGNGYTFNPLMQVLSTPISYASTFAAAVGGNPSAAAQSSSSSTGGTSASAIYLLPETIYMRSFAPWALFGPEPPICPANCFYGDNRLFSTSLSATARITGILSFWMPGVLGRRYAFSDPSRDTNGNTLTARPTISAGPASSASGYKLHMEFAGSNPLVTPSPDINTKLDFTPVFSSQQICYSGHLYGDAFPNAEVFAVGSGGRATMLLTFATSGDPNTGPLIYLPGNNNRDMGSFSHQCAPS